MRIRPAIEQRTRLQIVIVTFLILSTSIAVLRFPFTLDDAYITFRYARTFASGFPLGTWNPGEAPVEGFSSLLWTVLLAGAIRVGASPLYFSKIVGYLCALGMPLLAWMTFRRAARTPLNGGANPSSFASAAVLLSLNVPLFFYSVTGMETTLFSFLLLLLLVIPVASTGTTRIVLASAVCILITLTRPEGALLALLVSSFWLIKRPEARRSWWALGAAVSTLFSVAGLTCFRFLRFHEFLPNTYFAKATGGTAGHRLALGLRYEAQFLLLMAPAILVFLFCFVRKRRTLLKSTQFQLLIVILLAYAAYVAKVGGDPSSAFPLRRHFIHIAAVLALLLGEALADRTPTLERLTRKAAMLAVALACWIVAGWCLSPFRESYRHLRRHGALQLSARYPTWTWLARRSDEHTTVALTAAGEWPYYVPGIYIDELGLNDHHIAKLGRIDTQSPFQDSKSDQAYVLTRHPDIIESLIDADSLLHGTCSPMFHAGRSLMLKELLNDPEFRDNYFFIENGPYTISSNPFDRFDRALFFSGSYLNKLGDKSLKVVPVSRTSLYDPHCQSQL